MKQVCHECKKPSVCHERTLRFGCTSVTVPITTTHLPVKKGSALVMKKSDPLVQRTARGTAVVTICSDAGRGPRTRSCAGRAGMQGFADSDVLRNCRADAAGERGD